jgi:hypothetical protein
MPRVITPEYDFKRRGLTDKEKAEIEALLQDLHSHGTINSAIKNTKRVVDRLVRAKFEKGYNAGWKTGVRQMKASQ